VVVGVNHINDVELYFSNRTFLTLASGGFHLTRYVPGLERMFRNREHLVWYHGEEECLRLIEYYLERPRLRRRIAAAGMDWVRRRYGMTRQVNRILRMIDEQHGR
jgi:spore maturation protein CgeB